MARFRVSTRGLIGLVLLVGFDLATMVRALRQGRAAHALTAYAIGFGLVLIVFNVVVVGLLGAVANRAGPGLWNSTPSPLVIAALYLGVLGLAILSVLFLGPGLF